LYFLGFENYVIGKAPYLDDKYKYFLKFVPHYVKQRSIKRYLIRLAINLDPDCVSL
jgi:hypothetical protein